MREAFCELHREILPGPPGSSARWRRQGIVLQPGTVGAGRDASPSFGELCLSSSSPFLVTWNGWTKGKEEGRQILLPWMGEVETRFYGTCKLKLKGPMSAAASRSGKQGAQACDEESDDACSQNLVLRK